MGFVSDNSSDYQDGQQVDLTPVGTPQPVAAPQAPVSEPAPAEQPAAPEQPQQPASGYVSENSRPAEASAGVQFGETAPSPPPPPQDNGDNGGDTGRASVSVGVQAPQYNPFQQAGNYVTNTAAQAYQNWSAAQQDFNRGDYGGAVGNALAPVGRAAGAAVDALWPSNVVRRGFGAELSLAGLPTENAGLTPTPWQAQNPQDLANRLSVATLGPLAEPLYLGSRIAGQVGQGIAGWLQGRNDLDPTDRLAQAFDAGQNTNLFKAAGAPAYIGQGAAEQLYGVPVIGGAQRMLEGITGGKGYPFGAGGEFLAEEALNPFNYIGFGLPRYFAGVKEGERIANPLLRGLQGVDTAASLPFEAASRIAGNRAIGAGATLAGLGGMLAPAAFRNLTDENGQPVGSNLPVIGGITSGSWIQSIPEDLRPAAGVLGMVGTGLAAAALWRGGNKFIGAALPRTVDTAIAGQVVRDVASKAPQLLEGAKLRPDGAIVDTFNRPIQNARLANPGELIDRPRTLTAPTRTSVGNLRLNDYNSTMNYIAAVTDGDQIRANGVLTNVMREIVKDPKASADTLAKAAAAVTDPAKQPLAVPREMFNMPEVRNTLSGLRRTILNYVGEGPGQDAKIADFFNAFSDQNGNDFALMQSKLQGVYQSQLQRDLGIANPDWASPIRRYASILDDLQLNPAAKDALQQHMRQPILLERGSDVFNQIVAALDGRETAKARNLANQAIADIKQAAAKIQPDAQGRRPILPNALDERLVGNNINPWMDLMMGSKAIVSPFWLMGAPRYFVNNFVSDMLMLTMGTQFRGWHWALSPDLGDIALANRGHGALPPWVTGRSFANEIMGTGMQGAMPRQRGVFRTTFDRLGETVPGGRTIGNVVSSPQKGMNWIGEQIQKMPLMSETQRRKAIYVAQYVDRYDKELYTAARSILDGTMPPAAADAAAKRIVRSIGSGAPIDHWSAGVDFSGMDAGLRGTAEIMAREANSPQEFLANWQQFLADRRGQNGTLRGAVAGGPVYSHPTYDDAFAGQEFAARQERLGALDPNAQQPEIQLPESVRAAQAQARTAQGQAIQDALRERFGPEIDAAPKGPKPAPRPTPTPPPAAGAAPQAARNVRPYQRYYDDLLTVARQIAPDERTATRYADATWAIENARAWEWAKRTGRTADDYFATKAPKVRFENTSPTVPTPGLLPEVAAAPSGLTVKGEYDRAARIATAYQKGDVTTLIHETTHAFVDTMTDNANLYKSELDTTGKWLKAQGLQADYRAWGTPELEAIARGFERYTAEGIGVPAKLARVFDSLKTFFLNVYSNIKGSAIDVPVTSELRGAFRTSMGGERFSVPETRQTLATLSKMLTEPDVNAIDVFGGNQRQTYRDLAGQLNKMQGKRTNPDGLSFALRNISDKLQELADAKVNGQAVPVNRLPAVYEQWLTTAPERARNLEKWAESYRTFLEEYAVVPLPYAEQPRVRNTRGGAAGTMRVSPDAKRDYAVVRIADAPQLTNALKQSREAYLDAVKRLRVDSEAVVPTDIAEKATQPVTRAAQTAKEDLFPDTGTQQPPVLRQTGDPTPIFDQSARADLFPDQQPAPPQDVRAKLDEAGAAMATPNLDVSAAHLALEDAYAQLPPLFQNNPAALQDAVAQIRAGKKVSLPGNAADAAKRIADAEDAVMRAEQNANAAVKNAFEQAGLTQNVSDQAARDALRTIPDFINPDWRLADGTPYTGNVTRTATGYTTPDGQPLTFTNTMERFADGVPPLSDILDGMYTKAAQDAQNAVTAGMANAALPADIANVIDFQKMRELKNSANINAQQGALADTRGLLFGYDDRTYGQYLIDHWSPYAYWTISHVAQAGKYLAQHPGQYFTLMEVMADWAKQTENESPGNRWTIRAFTTPDGTEFRFRPTALLPFATQGIADIVNLATGDARGTALSEMLNALGMSPHFPIELGLQALTTHTDNPITPLYTGPQDMNRAADLLPQLQLLRRFTNGQVDVENASIFGVQFPPLSLRQNVYGTDRLGADDYWTGVELARRVKDGEITPADAKRAALSVREGKPNDVWLSAQGQAQGDQGKYALMRYFGLPVAVKPNERIRLDQLNADYYGQQGGLPAPGVRLTQERRDFLDANPDLPTSWAMNDAAQNLKRAAAQDDYYAAKDQLDAQFQAIFNDLSDKLTSGQMNVKQWKDAQSEQYQRRQEMYAALDAQFADRKLPKVDNPVFGTGNFGSNYVPPDAAEVKAVSDAVSAYFDVPYDQNNPAAQQQQRDALMAQLPPNIRQQALDTIFKNETPAQRYERTIIGPLEDRYYATPYYSTGTPEQQAQWDKAKKVYEDARYAEGGTPAAGRAALAAAGMPYALYQEAMNNRTGARNALLATPEFAPYKQWRDSLYGPSTTTPSNQTGQTTTRTTNAAYAPRTASQGYSRSSRAGGGNSQAAAFFADGGDYRRLSQSDNPDDKRQARLMLSQAYWNDGLRWSTMKEPPDKPETVRAQNERARLFETQPREEDSPTAYYRWLVDNGAKLNALNAQLGIEKRYLAGPQAKAMADRSAILDQYVALKAKNPDAARKFYAENADTLDRLKAIADGQPVQQAGRVTFPSTTAYTPRRGGGGGGGGGGRRPAPRPAAPTAHPLTIADFWRDAGPGLQDLLTAYWQGGAFPETARQFLLLLRTKYPFGLSPGVPLEQWLELVRQMSQQEAAA